MASPAPSRSVSRRRRGRSAVLLVGAVVTGLMLTAPAADGASKSNKTDDPGVMANLFEWNWASVGKECTDVLGPAGFGGVQVAPPQDSLKRQELGNGSDVFLHPWWEVYQPVDYGLTSRMGNEAQFKQMVKTCRKAGVKVYVDAVINHTTGQGNTSYGGVDYLQRQDYPGTYTDANFHEKGTGANDCTSASGGIDDFNNVHQVFKCDLVGLADLRTETPAVRNEVAGYLNKLIGYGVSGFRVDAAKHIGQTDLDAIYAKLKRTKDGYKPYWALEVFGGGPGLLSPQAFTTSGDVLGLDGVKQIRSAFRSYNGTPLGSLATLEVFGTGSGLTPSSKTLSFVQNHDTERNGDALNYKDGDLNILATEWLLASGYGTPQVYSGFTFTKPATVPAGDTNNDDIQGNSQSPPSDANGLITDTDCSRTAWNCTDRNAGVLAMVRWHNYVGSAKRGNWYTDGDNVIAFSRGKRGWVTFNNNADDAATKVSGARTIIVKTGLAKGTYCDLITGGKVGGACAGTSVKVNGSGKATVTVPARGAVAITKASRL